MSLKKRAVSGIVIAGSMVMMCAVADTAEAVTAEAVTVVAEQTRTDLATDGTAGVVVFLNKVETNALERIDEATASVETAETTMVAAAEETLTEEELAWQNRLMANVDEFLYVRSAGDENAEIVGKLYKGDVAEIVERGDTWTHITSGNVDGYVKNEYCVLGQDAYQYAQSNVETQAVIETDGLRIRSEAADDAAVITAVSTGTKLAVDTQTQVDGDWVAVEYDGKTAYVSAEYVSTDLALGKAKTIEEEKALLAAQEAEKAKAEQQNGTATEQKSPVSASVDEVTLLAAVIQCEAGNECYEGQVAVGAVVMNRVRSGRYPGSVSGVIYQSGQFSPAGSGAVDSVASRGPKASCMQAAREALSGADNTAGATRFRRASSGQAGVVIGNHVFY